MPSTVTVTALAPALTLTGTTCSAEESFTEVFLAPVTATVALFPEAPAIATETMKSFPDLATEVVIPL